MQTAWLISYDGSVGTDKFNVSLQQVFADFAVVIFFLGGQYFLGITHHLTQTPSWVNTRIWLKERRIRPTQI